MPSQKAAQPGNETENFVERGRHVRWALLVEDERGLPLIGLEHQLGIEVWATSPQPHEARNTPSHNHVQHQCSFYFLDTSQLQRLNAAAVFEHVKEHLDFPA